MVGLATGAACGGPEPLVVRPGEPVDNIGKADGSDEIRAELKLTIEPEQIEDARWWLGLTESAGQRRAIWFYDTWWLDELGAGAILRARKIDGEDDDSTIKLRPLEAGDLDPRWFDIEGFKCEIDQQLDRATPSCSLTVVQDRGEIDDVGAGDRSIDKLFSDEQEQLLAELGPGLAWDDLVPLGPIDALVWTIETDDLPAKLTVELWAMPDGNDVLELSMKVPVADADAGQDQLLDWVDEQELELAADQQAKTQRALELLTGADW